LTNISLNIPLMFHMKMILTINFKRQNYEEALKAKLERKCKASKTIFG